MSIFTSFILILLVLTFIGVTFLRVVQFTFIFRIPVYIFKDSIMSYSITAGLVLFVAIAAYFATRDFDKTVKRIKNEPGYVPDYPTVLKCLSCYKKLNITILIGNCIGFMIGQSMSTIVEAIKGINPINPYIFTLNLILSSCVGANNAFFQITKMNEIMGNYRKLLNIQTLSGYEKHIDLPTTTYIKISFLITILLIVSAITCVPVGLLLNPVTTGNEHLAIYYKDILIAFVCIIMLASPGLFTIVNALKKRLESVKTIISDIAEKGDLKQRINISILDDFGDLFARINILMTTLSDMIKGIKNGTSTVTQAAKDLNGISSIANNAISSVSSAFENINSEVHNQNNAIIKANSNVDALVNGVESVITNFNEQTKTLEENSTSLSKITQNIKEVADLTTEADALSHKLEQTSIKGKEALLASSEVIKNIQESFTEVGNIVKQISSIASQTNLLSMNASIEAAHAGEFGGGFSVVANEVRNLANESSKNAKNIQGYMKEMLAKIGQGVATINNAEHSFADITEQVQQSVELMSTIAKATETQKENADNTTASIQNLLNSIEDLNALTERQGLHAKELQSAMNDVVESTKKTENVVLESNYATNDLHEVLTKVEKSINENLEAVTSMNKSVDIFQL